MTFSQVSSIPSAAADRRVSTQLAQELANAPATADDWPLFNALGERSLGSTLFGDPAVTRGALEFARIRAGHPLFARARLALGPEVEAIEPPVLYARRCLYRRHQGSLLVTEVFLPSVLALSKPINNK